LLRAASSDDSESRPSRLASECGRSSSRIVDAFLATIRGAGGKAIVDADVAEVMVANGIAQGVRTSDARSFMAKGAVISITCPPCGL
jgi:phytoene dehydrogenase-like protein